jgi:hypothetical protein
MRAGPPYGPFVTASDLLNDEVASVTDPVRLVGRIHQIENRVRELEVEHRHLLLSLATRL